MKKILAPTDFSPAGDNAVKVAAAIAHKMGNTLALYHFYHIPIPASEVPFPQISVKETEDHVGNLLNTRRDELLKQYPGLKIETTFFAGWAREDIVAHSDNNANIDLIVMGVTGMGKLGQFVFGSTSVGVALSSKKPVLLVPEKTEWQPLKNVVFAHDFKDSNNLLGMEFLKEMVTRDRATIDIVHVESREEIPSPAAAVGTIKLDHSLENVKRTYHMINDTSVENGLERYLQMRESQLMVIVRRKHGIFEKIIKSGHTRKMPYHSNVPVLVLHEN